MCRANILLCIAFLLILLTGGWYLGQVYSELSNAQLELITAANNESRLTRHLEIRNSELLSAKQEAEALSRQFKDTQPRHFNSLEELKGWLAQDDTDQMQYCDEFNCIDFALQLQERALLDGYILSTEILPVAAHWTNIAVIGDVYYVVEPQDDRILIERER